MTPLPSKIFEFLFGTVLQNLMSVSGLNVLDPAYRCGYLTAIMFVTIFSGIFCQFYTILYMDYVQRVLCLSTIFIIPQAFVKLTSFIQNPRFFAEQVQTLRRFYQQCEAVSSKTADGRLTYHPEMTIVQQWATLFKNIFAIFVITVIITVVICLSYPIYVFVVDGRAVFFLPVFVPGVAYDTFGGMVVMWSFHTLMLCISAIGVIVFDLLMAMLILHVCTMSDVLCGKLESMSDVLQLRRIPARPNGVGEERAFLRQCLRLHQAYCVYVSGLADMYYGTFTTDILTNFISLCVMLFVQMFIEFFPIYCFMIVFLIKTFLVCLLGELVDIYVSS